MNSDISKNNWIYSLLLIPCISAILALYTNNFLLKSGTAGGGILILLILAFNQQRFPKDIWMIVAAFLFSIGGDWFLSHRNGMPERFITGIALFFFAHIGYLSFALLNGRIKRAFTLILVLGYLLFFAVVILPSINDRILMAAVLFYTLISCLSLGAALGIESSPLVKWIYVLGIFLILFSDTCIAIQEFTNYEKLGFLILPTYYLAQISITFSVITKYITTLQPTKQG